MRRLDSWMTVEAAAATLFALATLFMLQSSRAFVSYLVFVADQSQRVTIGTAALTVFAFPLAAWALVRFVGIQRLFIASVALMIATRGALQIIEEPTARLVLGGAVVIAWGILTVILATGQKRSVGVGLVLGFGLDLGLRTARGSLDLLWMPDITATAVIIVLLLLLAAVTWLMRADIDVEGGSWRSARSLLAIGPAIAIYHLFTGNIAFVSTHTNLSGSESSAVLAIGMTFGALIAVLRLLAINLGAGGGQIIGRFILFDAVIGAIALNFAWSGDGLALLGVFFVAMTATELVVFALAGDEHEPETRVGPVAIAITVGMLLQFAVLFVYYTSTGSGVILAIAWFGLVAGTFASALSLSPSLQARPFVASKYAAPAALVAILLAGSVLWSITSESSPETQISEADPISVITYNIQSGFSRDNYWDLEATAKVIEESGAEIVFLQEVSRGWLVTTGNDQLRWLSERLDMPYVWGPASSDDLWGNAILTSYPIISEQLVKYDSTENLKRSALLVELDIGAEAPLVAIATHLDDPEEAGTARSEQVDQLIELADPDRPTVLAGDFNMEPDDPLIQEILDTGFIDAALVAGADQGTAEDGRRIDYVFVTPDISVVSAVVIDSDASDHRPVAVDVSIR